MVKINPNNPTISKGRKKIEIAKIQNKNNLQVTFSKRRSGLFKKASELCTLCGVEIAIIVFSPAEKPFAFGHAELGSVLNRFLTNQNSSSLNSSTNANYGQLVQSRRNSDDHDVIDHVLNVQLSRLLSQLEAEKKKGRELDEMRKAGQRMCWWESSIDELMSLAELQQLKASMEELKNNVVLTRQAHTTVNNVFEAKLNGDFFPNVYNFGSGQGIF